MYFIRKGTVSIMRAIEYVKSNKWPTSKHSKETLTPKLMVRTAPGRMRNMSNSSVKLGISNLYALNKLSDIDVIETGTSLTLGTDYSYKNKKNDFEKFNLSLGHRWFVR